MIPLDVAELLRQAVLTLTTLSEAIHYWPNAPRPTVPYASVGINSMIQVGYGEPKDVIANDGDIDRKRSALFDIKVGVDFFRPDAMLQAGLFSGGLIRDEITEVWNAAGVGLVERSIVTDLTQVVNSQFEDRAHIDITMQALITAPDEKILRVDSVRVIGDIHNLGGPVDHVHIGPPLPPLP